MGEKYTSTFSKEKIGLILLAAMHQAVMLRASVRVPTRLDKTRLLLAKLDSRLNRGSAGYCVCITSRYNSDS